MTSAIVTDGITVINGTAGQWIRANLTDPSWALQSDWYINATTGNDQNVGNAAGTALKTWAEFRRRMQFQTIAQNVVVHIMSSLPEWLELDLYIADTASTDVGFSIQGDPSAWVTLYSGSCTGVIFMDSSSNIPPSITDANVGDWSSAGPGGTSLVKQRIRLTSGLYSGEISWIIKIIDPTNVRVAAWYKSTSTAPSLSVNSFFASTSNTFVVEQLPSVNGLSINVNRQSTVDAGNMFWVSDLEIGRGLSSTSKGMVSINAGKFAGKPAIQRSKISVQKIQTMYSCYVLNCLVSAAAVDIGGNVWFQNGASTSAITMSGGTLNITTNFIGQGCYMTINGKVVVTASGFFDATPSVFTTSADNGNFLYLNATVWGSGSHRSPVVATRGNVVKYNAIPIITGSNPGVDDFTYNGVLVDWGTVASSPNGSIVDATTMCGIVKSGA